MARISALKALIVALFILTALISFSLATETRTVQIEEISGTVEVKSGDRSWSPAITGNYLVQGDIIRTKESSYAVLRISGIAQTANIKLTPDSQLTLSEIGSDITTGSEKTLLDLSIGKVLVNTKKIGRNSSKFEVKTPTSFIDVSNATFSVAVEAVE